ncbi:Phototropic-responsive NPH3 family protein [Rhynchospora pubera]|uniref:Phototropic-responsive NPH3 family protein n=1 Tax=Rhynchospora pubera TaxID=906938 RepID=A0AAV8GEA5_9POAL|nr:Phototropic-responsive NPH3 family protein [Rhynchospora pubera]KAJ4800837.1 Phototropic-responsive NPH3 family protein [Rhynchospora pubera]
MAPEKISSKGQAWFCTTGLPSDIVIEVGEMSFHLHKFPLMSRSKKLNLLILDQKPLTKRKPSNSKNEIEEEDDEDEEEEERDELEEEEEIQEVELPRISLPNFPGGPEIFEIAAKFCYGVKIDMTPSNSIPLHCASDYLEMTEEFSAENLLSRTDRFLSQSVFRNLKDSLKALKSCEGEILSIAEQLGLVQRCIDAIASRANSSDLSSLFGWPITEKGSTTSSLRRKTVIRSDTWVDELAGLSLPIYTRVILAMKSKNVTPDLIEGSLISYAKRTIPGLSRSTRHNAPVLVPSEDEQRELLQTVISNLPKEKTSAGLNTAKFLFGLLRTVSILHASESSRNSLEKKIASQLEHATLDDLLIPSYSCLVETLYDVDCVERILRGFLEGLERNGEGNEERNGEDWVTRRLVPVGKLIDGYLAEIATDLNLRPERFCDLALMLPDQARIVDDGLYRAIDIYLKAHPGITEEDKERVTSVMDYQKLTLEACTHAAQNERLPLRAVVQVLFFEQLQLRRAITRTIFATEEQAESEAEAAGEQTREVGTSWRAAVRGNQLLRLDMDSMRCRVQELEKECTTMRKAIERIDKRGEEEGDAKKGSMVAKRFGCKFRTQVCDSQQRTVVAPPRRPRIEQSP